MFKFDQQRRKITAFGYVGDDVEGFTEYQFNEALDNLEPGDLWLHLKSDGGSIEAGMSIYNTLHHFPGQVNVMVDTMAASMGVTVMLAGDNIQISKNGKVMIHKSATIAMGNARDFRGVAQILDLLDQQTAELYEEKTGKSADYWLGLMEKETWMGAKQAVDEGLVHSIREGTSWGREPAQESRKPIFSQRHTGELAAKLAEVQSTWQQINDYLSK